MTTLVTWVASLMLIVILLITLSLSSLRDSTYISFYWITNAVIHCMCIIVMAVSEVGGQKHDKWHHYDAHNGRFGFQIDLAQQLMEGGTMMDWEDANNDSQ